MNYHHPRRNSALFLTGILLTLSLCACAKQDVAAATKVEQPSTPAQAVSEAPAAIDEDFRMVVQDVFRITGRGTVLTGEIAAGSVTTGRVLCLVRESKSDIEVRVEGIEQFRKIVDQAKVGERVGLLIGEVPKSEISPADVLHGEC